MRVIKEIEGNSHQYLVPVEQNLCNFQGLSLFLIFKLIKSVAEFHAYVSESEGLALHKPPDSELRFCVLNSLNRCFPYEVVRHELYSVSASVFVVVLVD